MKTREIHRLLRHIIQIIFFLWMPALYTSAYSGIRYLIGQIRVGEPIEANGFVVMLIALCGYTILFGRFFCGYACAFGSLGDGMYELFQWIKKKLKIKKKIQIPERVSKILQKLKYIVLFGLLLIYGLGMTERFSGTSPWEVFSMLYNGNIPDLSYIIGWILFVFILIGMSVKERFFCQYLCPMGAVFSWLPVLPLSVLDRNRGECLPKCRACKVKCPLDIDIKRNHKNSGECIQCMQCVDICPKQNIHLGSGQKWKGNEIPFVIVKLALLIVICFLATKM